MKKLCPCKSNKNYTVCCKKYHDNKKIAENALVLMKSRFSAYALGLVDYIIKTSHPKNPCFQKEKEVLKKDIENFCQDTSFENLEILDFVEEKNQAFVTFIAYLKTKNKKVAFTEISHFLKDNEKWLYKDGQIFEGAKKDI